MYDTVELETFGGRKRAARYLSRNIEIHVLISEVQELDNNLEDSVKSKFLKPHNRNPRLALTEDQNS